MRAMLVVVLVRVIIKPNFLTMKKNAWMDGWMDGRALLGECRVRGS